MGQLTLAGSCHSLASHLQSDQHVGGPARHILLPSVGVPSSSNMAHERSDKRTDFCDLMAANSSTEYLVNGSTAT